jgi:hypothetical protein
LVAVKTLQAPLVDGKLDDKVWGQAPVATSFIQYSPQYGDAASVRTEVRILYDNSAIYIGAYLYDDPDKIRKQITARDGESQQDVDYFSVFFDTYNDQQNGYQFLVTSANVQTDAKLSPSVNPQYNNYGDKAWDAVWQSKTSIVKDGWIVEMRIPYLSLRFPNKEVQNWGLQLLRFTRRNNETSFWNSVDPNKSGFVNQFGVYEDIKNIHPPLRLSFSPYISGGVRMNPKGMDEPTEWLHNGGMDVKYGINESFTLDATLIPDFGQVVSDNVTNNLTPYEIKFNENRPFFTEGTELFNKAGLFYSRRIGATPSYYDSVNSFAFNNNKYDIKQNPGLVQLYNAIKVSGRTKKKLGIGVFNAITAPMEARLQDHFSGKDTSIKTEPLTNYNIVVLDQALKGRSSITFTNANVTREGAERDANVSSIDWALFNRKNIYEVSGSARYSKVFGYTLYNGSINLIDDTTRLNGRMYVHPYEGFMSYLKLAKVSGKIQANISSSITSNTYDPNDLGYLQTPNIVIQNGSISYNQNTATKHFISYRYSLNTTYEALFKPYGYQQVEFWTTAFWLFRNFWDITFNLGTQPFGSNDYFELRTAKRYLSKPAFSYVSFVGSTDSRKRLFVSYAAGYNRAKVEDGDYYFLEGGVRYRFSDNFTLDMDVTRQDDQNQLGYAFIRENGAPIVGYRRNLEYTSVLSGIYNFTPRLNLTLRSRHYWNAVHYKKFFNVSMDGGLSNHSFIANQDENYNLLNTDAFLTWDFGLGSRMVLGWKNWLGDPYSIIDQKGYLPNLDNTFNQSHGNQLTLKLIFFLDYNQLKSK